MKHIRLFDKEFEHIVPPSYAGYDAPTHITWDKTEQDFKLAFYTERQFALAKSHEGKTRVAWLLEPRVIHNYGYDYIDSHAKDFEYILTSEKRTLDKHKHARFFPAGGSWIYRNDWQVYPKTQNMQIIVSEKDWTQGHRLRHEVVAAHRNRIDLVCGKAYKPFGYKLDVLKDFRFAIVIENCKVDYYFTDKLIDCFATGTIPIFWGCPSIGKFFNEKGIITFDNVQDLQKILDYADDSYYDKHIDFVRENFEKAKEYCVVEDYIYKSFIEKEL